MSREYDEADAQTWAEAPPRDAIDEYAREGDPFYAANPGPTSIDEIPWSDGTEPKEELQLSKPRRCTHPRERRVRYDAADPDVPGIEQCDRSLGGCGHMFDPSRQKLGRNVRKYGKREELADARILGLEPRGTSRDPEDSGGALDPAVVQSKTGPIHYPSASWIVELEALGKVANGRPRILVATPKTGPGIKRRKVAVLYLDELQELTGLSARTKALLELEALTRTAVSTTGYPFDRAMLEIVEKLEELQAWKR